MPLRLPMRLSPARCCYDTTFQREGEPGTGLAGAWLTESRDRKSWRVVASHGSKTAWQARATKLTRGPISRCTCHRCVDHGSQLDIAVDQPITSRANDGGQPVWSRNYGSRRIWRAYVARTCTPKQSTACKTEKMEHRGRVKEGPKGEAKTGDGGEVASAHVLTLQAALLIFHPLPYASPRLPCRSFTLRHAARRWIPRRQSPHPPSRHRGCNCKSNWVRDPDKLFCWLTRPTGIEDHHA